MTVPALTEQFADASAGLPGANELATTRRAAFEHFSQLSFPTRRIETWHYTDLTGLAGQPLQYVARQPDAAVLAAAAVAIEALGLPTGAPRCVFVDGHLTESLSDFTTAGGLTLRTLADAPALLLAPPGPGEGSLAALNTAFASAGVAIRGEGRSDAPVQLVFVGAAPRQATQLRLRIELGRDAHASVTQHFVDLPDSHGSWLNLVTDIELKAGSRLAICRLQRHAGDRTHTALTRARLGDDADFAAEAVEAGGGLVRNELELALAGERAHAGVLGLALTDAGQHCDTRIAIEHLAAYTTSRQDYRAIAGGRSRSVFNGKITVAEDAQHIDARQRNDNLLLAPTAEIDTKPELEIYADQVACSHGATVGELSEEQLFYLRSRGIDGPAARAILTSAFAEVILARFELESFRRQARAAVAEAMPGQSGSETDRT